MKTLYESLLDDFDNIDKSIDLKQIVKDWIKNNYKQTISLKISDNPNKDGKYEVSANHVIIDNRSLTSLTNDMFIWKKVGSFSCSYCKSLTSLEGAPKEVDGNFYCNNCDSLKTLEGASEEVGGNFDCSDCASLTSLEGAPEEVGYDFSCAYCKNLISLEGAPKKVGYDFNCSNCKSLTSLKGVPKKIGGAFNCSYCYSLKSYELPKETKIKGKFIK